MKRFCQIGAKILKKHFQQPKINIYRNFCSLNQENLQQSQDKILEILNSESPKMFRNIAIIAHVDHGKTTLVDTLIRNSGIQNQISMDSNQLEKEKGITILSKCTGVTYKGYKINIVDTPGHADFGGEVERIMNMVDGVALIVCASEGPMTQTKFVLQKALKSKLKPIVIINKVDRPTARVSEVENEIFDLFCSLDAPDESLDYPVFYASAKSGWAIKKIEDSRDNMTCILEAIINHIPSPQVETDKEFTMLVSQTESNQYFGKMMIGRINSGKISLNEPLISIDQSGQAVESSKVMKIIRRYGNNQIEMAKAVAGDIVSIAGFQNSTVSHVLNNPAFKNIVPTIPIEVIFIIKPPMIQVMVMANNSPLSGKEGTKHSSQTIKAQLILEAENDVALRFENIDNKMILYGRGDLHLGVLFERMRRQFIDFRSGFELIISPPEVVTKQVNGVLHEPYENLSIECSPEVILQFKYVNMIIEKLNQRKAEYIECIDLSIEKQKLIFLVPTRGLIGLRSQLLNETKGTAVMQHSFASYGPFKGQLKKSNKGAIISTSDGVVTTYSLKDSEKFGQMFIKPGMQVYTGMVIGENQKEQDQDLNPTKEKHLNNIRVKGHEEQIRLQNPKFFSIEDAISYIREDELLEITPQNIRIRKRELDPSLRRKQTREQKSYN